MIKAVKKFKLWSRKKRKRKTCASPPPPPPYDPPPPPPPPPPRHQCHCCYSYTTSSSTTAAQPSAPPLPPWMDYNHEIEALLAPEPECPPPELAYHPLPVPSKPESTAPALNLNPNSSYQQYMAPDPVPVYGIPVSQASTATEVRSAGFLGYVVGYLFRFFPCFRIREVAK